MCVKLLKLEIYMKRRIFDYSSEEQRTLLFDICNRLYIARNISLSQESILDELKKIDCLFKNDEYNDADE